MTELLAPAGSLASFYAAVNAGADAVYLSGQKFGARAYAQNFSDKELRRALGIAQLLDKKIYLTVNTLVKEAELDELIAFVRPLYEDGLDGVIVQDFGLLLMLREQFPNLKLHASTQMAVTGSYGAKLLKSMGVCRVVPARELSLSEIVGLKEKTGIEVECFVHGAMCYSYSGQCLFSSMLGERSGNRGRCAGPCRLPYDVYSGEKKLNQKKEQYQLGLKDLCTLAILPRLLDAGIDSFKIEGRMKSPEYVYFVTSLYRKYMDRYAKNPSDYHVDETDISALQKLFGRGDLQSGYFDRHHGRSMVTLTHSGYGNAKEGNAAELFDGNLSKKVAPECKRRICGQFTAKIGQPVSLQLTCGQQVMSVSGNLPELAEKRSSSQEEVRKQLVRMGDSLFVMDTLTIDLDDGLFLPNGMLNALRREAVARLEEALLNACRRKGFADEKAQSLNHEAETAECDSQQKDNSKKSAYTMQPKQQFALSLSVSTTEQLDAVCALLIRQSVSAAALYLSYDLFLHCFKDDKGLRICRELKEKQELRLILRLPPVMRSKVTEQLTRLIQKEKEWFSLFDALCIGSLEAAGLCREYLPDKKLISDARFYLFQPESALFFERIGIYEHILVCELNFRQMQSLMKKTNGHRFALTVYGRTPLMETAGCVLKTNKSCQKAEANRNAARGLHLLDRMGKELPVLLHCDRCENTILNSVPLSLHAEAERIRALAPDVLLLDFTTEAADETARLLNWYGAFAAALRKEGNEPPEKAEGCAGKKQTAELFAKEFPLQDFTKGHFLKGVE